MATLPSSLGLSAKQGLTAAEFVSVITLPTACGNTLVPVHRSLMELPRRSCFSRGPRLYYTGTSRQ